MKNKLKTLMIGVLVVFVQAQAAPPGGHLNVVQVFVDDPNDPTTITIVGEDLLFGNGPLTVTLGEYVAPLTIVGTPTDTEIVATLPVNIDDGDYLLIVANGEGQSQNDEYDLTIGAVGPQGEQGEMGDAGPQGVQGKLGPAGADGAQGDQGVQGKLGSPGDQGVQGKLGPAGADGAQGVQGKLGPAGADGDQGVQGKLGPAGADGAQGVQGKIGPPGMPGVGIQGEQGDQGVQGKLGPAGADGATGEPGPVGGTGNNVVNLLRPQDNMQPWLGLNYIIATQGTFPSRNSTDPLLAEIILFGGNFAPRGWAFCNGQLLSISSNSALFSLLGTTYGGDGRTTFALPDLRGRVPVHSGNNSAGPGLTPRQLGADGGTETEAQHNHDHTNP